MYPSLLFAFVFPTSSFGQHDDAGNIEILRNYKLLGAVKQVEYRMFNAHVSRDTFSIDAEINANRWPSKLVFDKNGYMTERSLCNMYGLECKRKLISYDNHQNLLKYERIEDDSVTVALNYYSYSSSGLFIEQIKYLKERDGLQISDILRYDHDTVGRLKKVNRFDGNDVYKGKFTYEYLGFGNQWAVFEEVDQKGEVEKRIERAFDDKKRIIDEISYDEGSLLSRRKTRYENDSVVSLENFTRYEGEQLLLRDAKYVYYQPDGYSEFKIVLKNGLPDTVNYEWVVFNGLGQITFKQKCAHGIVLYESNWLYNDQGQLMERTKTDERNTTVSHWSFQYFTDGRLKSEKLLTDAGMTEFNKWYYDEVGNWTHRIERLITPDIEYTHLHKRDILYFD